MRLGVFDSGVGGLSVARAIGQAYPEHQVEFVNDAGHLPYGSKSNPELLALSLPILQALAERSDIIVIACNTLTTNLIQELRQKLPLPLVGIEPMVKPAAEQTLTGTIAVCATPGTLRSRRYAELKQLYAQDIRILEPDCSDWAGMIESAAPDHQKIISLVESVCQAGADVIVLGCTHYHWIEELIEKAADGRAAILQPEQAVVRQLGRVLQGLPQDQSL